MAGYSTTVAADVAWLKRTARADTRVARLTIQVLEGLKHIWTRERCRDSKNSTDSCPVGGVDAMYSILDDNSCSGVCTPETPHCFKVLIFHNLS